MAFSVTATQDPGQVVREAGGFLASDPIRHNLILTLLAARIAHPEPGRYWVVREAGEPAGVVLQSPLHYMATVTPMSAGAVTAVVGALADRGVGLPGVSGVVATAAAFAGEWTERTGCGASPDQGQRIYEVEEVVTDRTPPGGLAAATSRDLDVLCEWFRAFGAETGEGGADVGRMVARRVSEGQLWLWDAGHPVAMAGITEPAAGAVRVGPVYTPPEERCRGYASALVAAVSRDALGRGRRCLLYTDLANPTSNAVYRSIGYRAVAEVLRYSFESSGPPGRAV